MISKSEIASVAAQWGLGDHIMEKDYALGWLLWGIAKNSVLSKMWILKGGSCIKKCYVDTHRYSQDLDFTVLPDGLWQPDDLQPIFVDLLKVVTEASRIDFEVKPPTFEVRPHGGGGEGKVYFVGPRGNPTPTSIKLDITHVEDLIRPPVLRSISHAYSDQFPDDTQVYCYSLEELFAEKLRAIGERKRPSDLYDVVYLYRRSDLNAEPDLIGEVLELKCAVKEISVPEYHGVCTPEAREEIEVRWQPMLGRGAGIIPEFDGYWHELKNLFAWLAGQEYVVELESISDDDTWEAPAIEWRQGQSEWLEPIRYAAVNRLVVDLGYGYDTRLVEPYSLRSSRAGAILFYAWKIRKGQIGAYRVDRIESIEVTRNPYEPRFPVEFTPKGRVAAPLVRRRRRLVSRWSSRSSRNYVVECSYCGKHFYREKYSLRINKHKQKDSDLRCPGRHGYLV